MSSHTHPLGPRAFTEGRGCKDGFLHESTGLEGHASIRQVEQTAGPGVRARDLSSEDVGEGIVAWKDRLIHVTRR